ncbi:hypothetical protein SFRURICE_014059 [Spodoptera frugiperda]|nr:hypothetical protein SFRURICE_014059 [Spodoptera frugiperda]
MNIIGGSQTYPQQRSISHLWWKSTIRLYISTEYKVKLNIHAIRIQWALVLQLKNTFHNINVDRLELDLRVTPPDLKSKSKV